MMRKCSCSGAYCHTVLVLAIVLFVSSDVARGVRTAPSGAVVGSNDHQVHRRPRSSEKASQDMFMQEKEDGGLEAELVQKEMSYVTGSRLPDCTHACGPCSPCKRVMVSFKCSESAESCPIAYRCMCRGKFYHVPSL